MRRFPRLSLLANGLLFYFGWFFVVSSAANRPYFALVVAAVIVTLHMSLVRHKAKELILILTVVAMGFCVETAMIRLGILAFSSPNIVLVGCAPFWVLGLYALLAITVNHALSWLQPYPLHATWLGCFGGIFSYAAGERLGAVAFLLPEKEALLVVGLVWFFLMPIVFAINKVLDAHFGR